MICWAPFGLVYLVKLLGFRTKKSNNAFDVLPLLCVKMGCAVINPIVYAFENTKVSKALYWIFWCEYHFIFLSLPTFDFVYTFSFIEEKKSAPTEEQGWMLYYQSLLQLKDDVASRWNSSQNHLLTLQVIRHRINSMEFLGR